MTERDELFLRVKKERKEGGLSNYEHNKLNEIILQEIKEEIDPIKKALIGNDLLIANEKIAYKVISKYQATDNFTVDDMLDIARKVIWDCAKTYDKKSGASFATYIHKAMNNALRRAYNEENRQIQLSETIIKIINDITSCENELMNELKRNPTDKEIAKKLSLPFKKYQEARRAMDMAIHNVDFYEESLLGSTFSADKNSKDGLNEALELEQIEEINDFLNELKTRDKEIIEYSFGLNQKEQLSVRELAKKYSLSEQAIRDIQKKFFNRYKRGALNED